MLSAVDLIFSGKVEKLQQRMYLWSLKRYTKKFASLWRIVTEQVRITCVPLGKEGEVLFLYGFISILYYYQ